MLQDDVTDSNTNIWVSCRRTSYPGMEFTIYVVVWDPGSRSICCTRQQLNCVRGERQGRLGDRGEVIGYLRCLYAGWMNRLDNRAMKALNVEEEKAYVQTANDGP